MSFSGKKGYVTKPKPGVMLNPLHPLSRGLIGYWLFNEGAGIRTNDISGHGNHGTLENTLPNVQGSGWGGSKFGGGIQFDGTNDRVDVGSKLLPSENKDFSVFCWAKRDGSKYGGIISKDPDDGGHRNWFIAEQTSTNIYYRLYETDYTYIEYSSSAGTFPAGVWTFLGLIVDVSNTKLYAVINDAVIDITSTWDGTIQNQAIITYVGMTYTTNYCFNGVIDHVRMYDRAVPAKEATQLYHDPFCDLLYPPLRRYHVAAAPAGAIMNQFQNYNIGADLYNGGLIA